MKIFIATILGLVLFLCGSKVKLIDATSQEWIAGRYESGRGTDYILTLKARGGSENLVIDKLWVGEVLYEVYAVKDRAKRSDREFDKGDTIYVQAGKKLKPDETGKMVTVSGKEVSPPVDNPGAALLSYTWKGKRKHLEIDDFRELEKIIYP